MQEFAMVQDPDTGDYIYVRLVGNRICPYYLLDTKVAQSFAGYCVISRDLHFVKHGFEAYKDFSLIDVVKLNILIGALTIYGRCFAKAEGRKVKLEPKSIFTGSEHKRFKRIHDNLIHLRNNYAAHAGIADYDRYAITLTLNPDTNKKFISEVMINGCHQVNHTPHIPDYLQLIEFLVTYVEEAKEAAGRRLDKEKEELDIEEVYRRSKLPTQEKFVNFSGIPMPGHSTFAGKKNGN